MPNPSSKTKRFHALLQVSNRERAKGSFKSLLRVSNRARDQYKLRQTLDELKTRKRSTYNTLLAMGAKKKNVVPRTEREQDALVMSMLKALNTLMSISAR